MKKMLAVLLISTFALQGCAAIYEKKLASFKGATEPELIRDWGAPQSVYESDGRKFLTYRSSRIAGFGGMIANYSCQTTFELENGRVVSANFKGDDC